MANTPQHMKILFSGEIKHDEPASESLTKQGVVRRMPTQNIIKWVGGGVSLVLLGSIGFIVPVQKVWNALLLARPLWVISSMFLILIHLRLRGSRWALLFLPHYRISGASASIPVIIGLAMNGVFPGKIGELVRIGLGARQFKTGITFTTMTAINDRLFDAITLVGFLSGSLFLLPTVNTLNSLEILHYHIQPDQIAGVMKAGAITIFTLLGLVASLVFSRTRRWLVALSSFVPLIGNWLPQKVEAILAETSRGIAPFKNFRVLSKIAFLSAAIWLPPAFAAQCVAFGTPGIELNLAQAFLVTMMSVGMAAIPSAPGAWGVFEAGTVFALQLLGIQSDLSQKIAFALILHSSFYIPTVVTGGILLMKTKLSVSEFL